MKAPWKYLARLTSRRPAAEAQESSIGNDTAPKALESEGEHTSAHPPNSTAGVSPPANDEDPSADQGSVASDQAKADDDVTHALRPPIDAEEAQTQGGGIKPTIRVLERIRWCRKAPQTRSWRANRRSSVENVGREPTATWLPRALPPQSNIKACHPCPPRESFFHNAATLDEEIKILRAQLAQKLHLQNAQLKKMLERFDVS
jgi:hypothetical protein